MMIQQITGFLSTIVLVCAFIAGVAGCNRDDGLDLTGDGFRYIDRGDIITLDLNQMSYLQDFRVMYAMREGLYSYDPVTSKPIPALAVKTSVSEDGRVWTFTLRDDAKWSNGDPVVAGDFVFSWRLMLESPGSYSSLFYSIRNAARYEVSYRERGSLTFDDVGVRAPDDHTLIVTLDEPVLYLEDLLAFPPFYPRHEASMRPFRQTDREGRESYSELYTRPGNVVTNGPFNFAQWEFGERLVFTKSKTYWDAPNVKLDWIEMRVDNDAQSAYITYDQGDADWLTDIHADIALPLRRQGRADLKLTPDYGTAFLSLNCRAEVPEVKDAKNPLADVRVRRALAMVIDKKQIVESITRLGEQQADHYVPPGYFENFPRRAAPSYDIEAARKLLAEAGYPGGANFPTLSFLYNTDNPVRRDLSQALTRQWREALGVRIESRPMELKGYRNDVKTGNYTIAIVAWFGDYMDPSTWTDKYRSSSLNNDTNWTPPEYDKLLDDAARETDGVRRMHMLAEAESMLNEQVPIIPLYHYVNRQMYRDDVRGITPNPRNTISWKAISVTR